MQVADKDNNLANAWLRSIKLILKSDFLVSNLLRNDKLMPPKGDFLLKPEDAIGFITDKDEMTSLFFRVDLDRRFVRSECSYLWRRGWIVVRKAVD